MRKFIPILAICIVWAIFAAPFFIKDQTPYPAKFQTTFFAPWSAYPEYAGPVKNEAMPDIIGQIYPWRDFTINVWKTGAVPLWNPYSFSGTPHLANYQSAVFSPLNIGFVVFPFKDWWTVFIVLQPLLAGVFTYLFTRSLKIGRAAGFLSSVAFMFCGFIVTWMGYGSLAYAILYLPLALFAIEEYFANPRGRFLLLLALTIPLSFFSGHFQISIYFLLFTTSYILFKGVTTRNYRAFVFSLLPLFFGFCLTAPQLIPSVELYTQSFRSTIFVKTEVIPWAYLPTLLAPDFFGNPVTGNDWFGHYAEWNAYIGIIPLFFALYSLRSIKKPHIMFFAIWAIVAFLLAFQSPLLDLLVLLKIPVISTSAASRIIVLFSFSMAILSGFGFEVFLNDVLKKRTRGVFILISIFAIFFAVLWSITTFKLFMPADKIIIAASNLRLPSLVFTAFSVALIGIVFLKKKKMIIFLSIIVLFIAGLDLARFVHKWQPYDSKSLIYASTGVAGFYPKMQGEARTYGNFGAEGMLYYRLQGVEGYDAVYIRRYGQFIASLSSGKLTDSYRSVVSYPKGGKYALLGANFLGIKYIVHKFSDAQNVWEFPFWEYKPPLKVLFDDGHYQVLENTNAFPRAFLVSSVSVEKSPQKILNKMFSSKTNLRQAAVVEESLVGRNTLSSGSAQIVLYEPNKIDIKTSTTRPSFLVLTDAFYPGWNAYIDKNKTKIYRTDFAFRGVQIPAGKHTVEFRYEPESFSYGIYTAIIGLIGILILVLVNKKTTRRT